MTTVKIGAWRFDHVDYDADRDVLYLSIGEPRPGYGEETPEGHVLRFDESGEFCGVTLIGIQEMLDRDENVTVTMPPSPPPPRREHLPRRDLDRVLTAS